MGTLSFSDREIYFNLGPIFFSFNIRGCLTGASARISPANRFDRGRNPRHRSHAGTGAAPARRDNLGIEFINKETGEINTHINYSVAIEKDGNEIFATDHLHTSEGTVTVPFEFEEVGKYDVVVILEGAMFMPLEPEEARFALSVGEAQEPPPPGKDDVATETEGPAASIPDWVKQTAAWWGKGEISNTEFAAGIQFMIEQGLITVNARTNEESASDVEIPDWVKENAVWWSEGMISDQDFARGIEFLVEKGIVSVQ